MISKEEYIKKAREALRKGLPTWDAEENIQKYIDGIDYDDWYEATKINLELPGRTVDGTINAFVYNAYLLYPDY
ncbi:MAG: hypothetical protein Q4E28_01845 [Clostridia bacterium]|nr:hypothetical protein [Clostridia bacterium]